MLGIVLSGACQVVCAEVKWNFYMKINFTILTHVYQTNLTIQPHISWEWAFSVQEEYHRGANCHAGVHAHWQVKGILVLLMGGAEGTLIGRML